MGYLCMRTKLVWQMSCFKIYDACSQIKDITKKPSKSPSLLHKQIEMPKVGLQGGCYYGTDYKFKQSKRFL